MIRVACLPSDQGACGWYRLLQPLRLLERQGHIKLDLVQTPDGRFAISSALMRECDVTILQKPGGALEPGNGHEQAFLEDVRANGWRVVYEIDDDLENITADNPVHHPSRWPGYIQRTRELMQSCRMLTTTTHYAAMNLMRRHKMPARVVPNGIDLDLWRPAGWTPPDNGDEVRIVWAASPNHVEDSRLLIRPFREIARRYPQARFILAGPEYPYSEETGKRGVDWRALAKAIGPRCEWVGASAGMEDWPAFARSLRADIWVAPLVNSVFSRSKSSLKFLEGTAVGAAVVASDVEPYRCGPTGQPWGEMGPMMLCRDADEWVKALSVLIEMPHVRSQLRSYALAVLRDNYTAQHSAHAWLEVLREVSEERRVARARKGMIGA